MQKRGQVTIFVILGILIVILIALLFLFQSSPRLPTGGDVETNIEEFTTSCLENIGRDALKLIGIQGGYYQVPAISSPIQKTDPDYGTFSIPHWQFRQDIEHPTYPVIETEISNYIQDHIDECTNNFEAYQQEGWTITADDTITTQVSFQPEETLLTATYPLTATKEGETITFTEFGPVTIPWDVYGLVETSIVAANIYGNERYIPVGYVVGQGYNLYTVNEGQGSVAFRILSHQNDEEREYVWIFAVQ